MATINRHPEDTADKRMYRDNNARVTRTRRFAAAVALAGTAAGFLGVNKLHENHQRNVSRDAVGEAINEGRLLGVKTGTNIFLREGVTVRTEPKIIPRDANSMGNELMKVEKGDVLVISSPVVIDGIEGKGRYWAATMPDGRIGYVSTDVADQVDDAGDKYAIVQAPEHSQDPFSDDINPRDVHFDMQTGVFSIGEQPIAASEIMPVEEAFKELA